VANPAYVGDLYPLIVSKRMSAAALSGALPKAAVVPRPVLPLRDRTYLSADEGSEGARDPVSPEITSSGCQVVAKLLFYF
jgi:hypothetical protein